MTARLRLFCVGCCLAIPAIAPSRAASAKSPGETPEFATKFLNTGKSLQAHLDSGFRVVSSHLGLDTVGFVLEHDGKWITCSVRNSDKSLPDQMLSQCFAMN